MLNKDNSRQIRGVVQKKIASVKKDTNEMRKDLKQRVFFFDRRYLELRKRIEKIEQYLGITFSS